MDNTLPVLSVFKNGELVPLGSINSAIIWQSDLMMTNTPTNQVASLTPLTPEEIKLLREQKMTLGMAKNMAEGINNLQMQWVAKVQFMSRSHRRRFSRNLVRLVQNFDALCKRNGIQYTITKDNEER